MLVSGAKAAGRYKVVGMAQMPAAPKASNVIRNSKTSHLTVYEPSLLKKYKAISEITSIL